jgi:hypothetical protein
MLEAEFQSQIVEAAKLHRVEAFHVSLSIRSEPGWPDLVLVGPNGAIFRELKTMTGKVSEAQKFWLAILGDAGLDVGVWRPDQWPHPIVDEIRELGRITRPKPVRKPRKNQRTPRVSW